MSESDYYLDDEKLKDGVKMPLRGRDGKLSDDFIMVRWAWHDKTRAALDDAQRKLMEVVASGEKPDASDVTLDAIVSMVAGWSFESKPTAKNVRAFLKRRPDIAERIDKLSANTSVFFGSGEPSS